uniref:Disrupted in schizophrenia 1 protein n=1 Tax=Jaculus jaculus TaxID=51337 RepID=A0A8C5K322_JACJA
MHCFLFSDSRGGSLPVASPRRRRLARRPGYMRSLPTSGIGFHAPAEGTARLVPRGLNGEEVQHSESRAGHCGLDPSGQCQGLTVGSPIPESSAAPAVASVGPLHLDQNSEGATPVHFGIQHRAGTRLPERLTRPCGPGDSGHRKEVLSMDSTEACGPNKDVACSEGARNTRVVGSLASSLERGPDSSPAPPGSQVSFASNFSFIQLSLRSAGERGEAEGCLLSRASSSAQETGAIGSDQSLRDPRGSSWASSLPAPRGPEGLAQAVGSSSQQPCGLHSLALDTGSFSLDASLAGGWGDEGSALEDGPSWHALLGQWEPALHDCLLSNRRQLGVTSLSLKLQKLQEKAIEDEDYDKGEV